MTIFSWARGGLFAACATLITTGTALASGGYDNGTPAGRGNLDLEFTLNPGDAFEDGQTYVVWGYGLTEKLDFHGYVSHEANGTDQFYLGLMYNFYSNEWLDLSTAIGFRQRSGVTDIFLPQLLYTIKLPNDYDIIGSAVNVYNTTDNENRGVALDVGLRIPLPTVLTPKIAKDAKLTVGAFRRAAGGRWLPTYSVDLRF
ncbi:hypothetical protein [uncultured Litoreibacter sp.]|uniref:hypothetical protein n=1 Tax=uncultured Litoreibacter sp. TaxID=1392394 RepID=UPI00260FB881|nr:hypothetical protein [uncultured Litoreibacter sp.]